MEQPFIANKEFPYHLHAIMIHDGLAENGHYYTYIRDSSGQNEGNITKDEDIWW